MQTNEYQTLYRDCANVILHPWAWNYIEKDDIYVCPDEDGCTHEWHAGKDVRRLRDLMDQRRAA